jgi:diguanylate cyclase (GGDEF)-like protein
MRSETYVLDAKENPGGPLEACFAPGGLRTVLQPILDLRYGCVYGYEALTRGPAGSAIEAPTALFDLAQEYGMGANLEQLAARCAIEQFGGLQFGGKLFLNFSPAALGERRIDIGAIVTLLATCRLAPKQVVIELSENSEMRDSEPAWEELLKCRALGFGIAIDDLGEGFASLRLWSDLRPEYVKVDRHFVHGIQRNPLKLQMVRSIQQIAQAAGSSVVAEGIEEEADFQTIRDLGIRHGQGFLIGRPAAQPDAVAPVALWTRLSGGPIPVFPIPGLSVNRVTARRLVRSIAPISPDTPNDVAYGRFEDDPDLQVIPVVEDGIPRGMINRLSVIDRFARPYRRELYGKRPCSIFMNAMPVVVDLDAGVQEISALVSAGDRQAVFDGFIVIENGRYVGVGTAQDLMREITDMQMTAARYANPLTLLPGNVPIAEHTERLIASGCRFAACYADLDHFKPFNDVFGYQRGDEVIQLAARVLAEVSDPQIDFIGHVGGDDFVALMQSEDWEARCRRALAAFGERVASQFADEDRARGGFVAEDRQGNRQLFPLLTISIGAVPIEPGTFESHAQVAAAAAEAKHMAKKEAGGSLFVERRRFPTASVRPVAQPADAGPS